jgi:hypothetical protein
MSNKKDKKFSIKENDPYLIMSNETGEIVGSIGYGDSIRRKEQDEHFKEYDDNFNEGEKFVKIFDKTLSQLIKKLTNGEIAFVIKLLPYISFKDGILRDENKKILTINNLAEKMELTHEGVRKVLMSLIAKGVLGEHRTGCIDNPKIINKCITVNPFIFMKGKQMNRTIIGLFEKTEWNNE